MLSNFDPYGRDDDVSDDLQFKLAAQESASRPLRIAAPVFEPYTYPCILRMKVVDSTTCQYPGIAAEILHYALRSANLSYTLIPTPKVESWGKMIRRDPVTNAGIFDGLLGDIINGTLDTVLTSWGMTDVRMSAMDYTFPIQTIRTGFGYIMRKPYEVVDMSSASFLFLIFPLSVWGLIGGVTLSIAILIWLSELLNKIPERGSIFGSFWRSLIMLFHQHEQHPPRTISSTIITTFSILGLMLLHKIYEAYLVEELAKQVHLSPFISMTQLASLIKLGEYKLISYDLSDFYFTQVMYGEGNSFIAMREAINEVPPIIEPLGMDKIIDRLLHDPKLVLPGIPEISAPHLMKNRCDLMFIRDLDMSSSWGSFLFKRRSVNAMAVSQAMATMTDFMIFIGEKYYSYQTLGDTCERNVEGYEVGSKALRIEDYYGLLFLCVGFFFISFAILVTELYIYWRQKKKAAANSELQWPDFSLSVPSPEEPNVQPEQSGSNE